MRCSNGMRRRSSPFLQEAVKACCTVHVAQKARREAEAKAKEEAEK